MIFIKSKFFFISILCLLLGFNLNAQTDINVLSLLCNHKNLKHASVGISIKDMEGNSLVSYNANKSYTPASILKLVTTATSLEVLGQDFLYKTTLAKDKSDSNTLLIRGYGDPTLGTSFLGDGSDRFLEEWILQISKNYSRDSLLNIKVLDDYFGYDGISQRWIYQDMGNYYAAGAYGVSVFDNTYKLYFNTMRRDTCPVIIRTEPSLAIQFKNTLSLNTTGSDNAYIHGFPFFNQRLLTGNIPAGRSSFTIKGDIPDPGLCLAETLAQRLEKEGFRIGNVSTAYKEYYDQMSRGKSLVCDEDIFYTHTSFPLTDILNVTNVRSNNHYAEHLIRTLGRVEDKDYYASVLDSGINKILDYWKAKGFEVDALSMYDGSGLSPANAVSADFMTDLLVYMHKDKNAQTFLNTLPKAGREGTVRRFLKGCKLEGKVYVKSGSIKGVQCYSGYYIDGNRKYAFTVMVNNYTGSRQTIVKAIEQFLLVTF